MQTSKVKVTQGQRYIWRPGGGMILDPFGRVDFLYSFIKQWPLFRYIILDIHVSDVCKTCFFWLR